MEENENIDIDKFFSEKLKDETMQPSPELWGKIEKRLHPESKKRPGLWIIGGIGVLAIIILSLIFVPKFISKENNNNKISSTENKKQETGNGKQETENKKQETRNEKQETRNDSTANEKTNQQPTTNRTTNNQLFDYRIQLGTFVKQKDVNSFNGLSNVVEEKDSIGKYHYYTGPFTSEEKAKENIQKVLDAGYNDAFIVGFLNGKNSYLPDEIAMAGERKKGSTKSLKGSSINSLKNGSTKSLKSSSINSLTNGSTKSLKNGSINSLTSGSTKSLKKSSIKSSINSSTDSSINTSTNNSVVNNSSNNNSNNSSIKISRAEKKRAEKRKQDSLAVIAKIEKRRADSVKASLKTNVVLNKKISDSLLADKKIKEEKAARDSIEALATAVTLKKQKTKEDSVREAENLLAAQQHVLDSIKQQQLSAAADSIKKEQDKKDSLARVTPKDTTKKIPGLPVEKNWIAFNVGYNQVMNTVNQRVNAVDISSEKGSPSWAFGINYGRKLIGEFFVSGNAMASQNIYTKDQEATKFNKHITDYYYLPTSVANIPIYKDTMLNGFSSLAPIDTFGAYFGYKQQFTYLDGALNAGYTFKKGRFRIPVSLGYNFSYLLNQKTVLDIRKENFSQHFEYNNVLQRKNYSSFVFSAACEIRLYRRSYFVVEGRLKYSTSNVSTTPGVNYKPFIISVPIGYKIYF